MWKYSCPMRVTLPVTIYLAPANEVCEGYVFTGVCHSVHRGGGMRGCFLGVHAWLLPVGACMVAPGGVCGSSRGGMCGCSGVYVVVLEGGVCGCSGGHAWLLLGGMCHCSQGGHAWDMTRYGDTINERAVRILLECILVQNYIRTRKDFSLKASTNLLTTWVT